MLELRHKCITVVNQSDNKAFDEHLMVTYFCFHLLSSMRCRLATMYLLLQSRAVASNTAQLYAVGGYTSGNSGVSSVETLPLASGTWAGQGNELNVARDTCVGASRP